MASYYFIQELCWKVQICKYFNDCNTLFSILNIPILAEQMSNSHQNVRVNSMILLLIIICECVCVCVFFLVYYLIYFRQKYAHILRWRTFNRNARFFDSFVTYFAVAQSFVEFMIKLWPFFSFYKNNHSLIHSEISCKRVNKYNYNYIELAINHSALTRNQRHNDIQFLNSIIIPC